MFSSNASQVSNDANYIEDVFSTDLYTGTGSAQTITNGIDFSTKGGLIWFKSRSNATNHQLGDSSRNNFGDLLITNATNASASASLFTPSTTGYTVNNTYGMVDSGRTQVVWSFRKQPKFFDVVTYTGTGSPQDIAHSLGSTPGCIIIKKLNAASFWTVYHRSLTSNSYALKLNTTDAEASSINYWNNTSPTSTQFTVGVDSGVNASGSTFVAYIFAHDAGGFGLTGTDNVISCGSYTGNGSETNGTSVTLGYEPQWLLVKAASTAANWFLVDNMRGWGPNNTGQASTLNPNLSDAESANAYNTVEISSTGFKLHSVSDDWNGSGKTYIYIAIRRGPMKVPTDATKVFNPSVRASGTGGAVSTTGLGFPPDLLISTERTTGALFAKGWHDRLRGSIIVLSNSTNNEAADSTGVTAYGQDGFSFGADGGFATVNYSGSNYVYEALRRAPSFFDEVCYTGTGANRTVTHNLAAVPELMIVKRRDTTGGWMSYSAALGNTQYLFLNSTSAAATLSTPWNNTSPTASVFSLGTNTNVNTSGGTYVAYLFATCAGVSKVGSYTGTGTTKQVDCGFAAGARFVLVKATSTTGNWIVVDTARGLVSGNDPTLLLNSTAAEVTSTDWFDPYSAGFELSNAAGNLANTSGTEYIYFAVA